MQDDSRSLRNAQPADGVEVKLEGGATGSETVSFKGETDRGSSAQSLMGETGTHRIGDFELMERIASGGMGVVYKARQVSMNRMVALKLIRAEELAADEAIERFCFEAQTAGQLNHPGIVPVYERGRSDGRNYYAMAYVAGESLAARIKRSPLVSREAAELLQRVADALHFAHTQGVIHRDLKPGNILLDVTGAPHLADFGLARRQDVPHHHRTLTGQVLGTPSYMPPEQARGELNRITAQSDVYSLGAVLYDVLTGHPPFQGASIHDTLRLVVDADPVAPRRLNPAIDQDLETICLKCLEKEPAARYPSALAVREELDRYLAGQPILARPLSPRQRLWKWSRRHPQVAGLLAVILMLVLLGMGGAAGAYLHVVGQRNLARGSEAKARSAAEETVDTLKFVAFDVHERLQDQPGTESLREQLLHDTVPRFEKLYKRFDDFPEVQRVLIKSHIDLGDLYLNVGQTDRAAATFERAMEMGRELAARHPDEGQLHLPFLTAAQKLAIVKDLRGDSQSALELYHVVQTEAARMPADEPQVLQLRFTNAYHLGILYRGLGREMEAANCFEEALELAHKSEQSGTSDTSGQVAECRMAVAERLVMAGQFDEALEMSLLGVETLESQAKSRPNSVNARDSLAAALVNLGRIHQARMDFPAAREPLERAVSIRRAMTEQAPENVAYQRDLSVTMNSLAMLLGAVGESLDAYAMLLESLAINERLMIADPGNSELQFDYGVTCYHLAEVDRSRSQAKAVRQWLERGRPLLAQLADSPNRALWLGNYAEMETYCHRVEQCVLDAETLRAETDPDVLLATLLSLAHKADLTRLQDASDHLLSISDVLDGHRYNMACAHVEVAGVLVAAGKTAAVEPQLVRQTAEEFMRRAIGELDELRGRGFFRQPGFENLLDADATWQELNTREDFRQLKRDVAADQQSHAQDASAR